jgi:hypothetical protein
MIQTAEAVMTEEPAELQVPVEAAVGLRGLEIDDELVLIDLLSDRSFRLNATGRHIWTLLQQRCTVGDVADSLVSKYGLDTQAAREVATTYLAQLQELGLVAMQGETTQRE